MNQNGRINLTDPFSGVAQLSGLQAIDSLPNEVGYDSQVTIDWHFSVANNEFYSAESSNHKIYRTLDTPSATYHTVVHTACAGISGTSNIVQQIWGKFAGLSMVNAFGFPMTYWGEGDDTPGTLEGLIKYKDGRCGPWADFFYSCLKVHSINSQGLGICPDKSVLGPNIKGFIIYENLPGQNNNKPEYRFQNHAVVLYGYGFYDPSYGKIYYGTNNNTRVLAWEDSSVDKYGRQDNSTFSDTKGVRECKIY